MADYDIVKALEKIEKELMDSMVRNLDHHRAMETDEGFEWSQWQVEQLKALENYKKKNRKKYGSQFKDINKQLGTLIYLARNQGNMDQEIKILEAIKKGFTGYHRPSKKTVVTDAAFFRVNDRKIDALIEATTNDFEKAEYAMLRRADDKYRKVIFDAQVYANAGGTTYEKAVDMALEDFLKTGINCIEYSNGARHTMKDYADMCIRTATKRAYLTGEGEMMKEWGISLVILNKRGNACPKCAPFVGKVMVDDVWAGGKADGKHMLISKAIEQGLYHPRCKDIHTTYFEGINTMEGKPYTKEEKRQIIEDYNKEQKVNYCKRQIEQQQRMADIMLDMQDKSVHQQRADEWRKKEFEYMDTEKFIKDIGAREAIRNTNTEVHFNNDYDYSIKLDGYNEKVNNGLSEAAKEVARLGDKDRCEHLYLVDLQTGALSYYETNGETNEVGFAFKKFLNQNKSKKFAFVHNHNTDGSISETDMRTLLLEKQIPVMIAVRNDSVKYIAEREGEILKSGWFDDLYEKELEKLKQDIKDGKIMIYERALRREEIIVDNLIRDYTKGGMLIEQDGRKQLGN